MVIDRRMLLRGMGKAVVVGASGAALAVGASAGPSGGRGTDRPGGLPDSPLATARPAITPRTAWQAAEPVRREHAALHADAVKAVFLHHTGNANDYARRDVPGLIRAVYEDHVGSRHWDDIGYNFLVDRTGTIYEGRAGSIEGPEVGAHTEGFNIGTVGIAAIGDYAGDAEVPGALLNAVARIAAWKLGMYGVDARGTAVLFSSNDRSRFPKGSRCVFRAISGHRDGFVTTCPGAALYAHLPQIRDRAARLQRRSGPSARRPA
ncbi:N-acetylmuramoyl-L-alanine amidase [Streptomyces sp. NPDC050161]|uniref:N-acetylmuramoyl-L-alanine amidase n=1 Tax=Streptomyces sp. NPDC050161 TaxID=3365604 RepID=UPI0037AADD36